MDIFVPIKDAVRAMVPHLEYCLLLSGSYLKKSRVSAHTGGESHLPFLLGAMQNSNADLVKSFRFDFVLAQHRGMEDHA